MLYSVWLTLNTSPNDPLPIRPRLVKHWLKYDCCRVGSYTFFERGDFEREQDSGVQGERCCGNSRLTDAHPLDGVRGASERESREGEEKDESDGDNEDPQPLRFLMEKHCSAWLKWAGRGRATLGTVVSTAKDIVHSSLARERQLQRENYSTFKMSSVKIITIIITMEMKSFLVSIFSRKHTAMFNLLRA